MRFIEVNGVGLRYELSGREDRTVVLIREMGGSLESWDEVAPVLAANRRVLRYDTRGAGLSEKVRGVLSIDTMVDDLAALLDALGVVGTPPPRICELGPGLVPLAAHGLRAAPDDGGVRRRGGRCRLAASAGSPTRAATLANTGRQVSPT